MNMLNYGLSQLLNELQTFESIQRQGKSKESINVTDWDSSSRAKPQKRKAIASTGPGRRRASSSKGKGPAKDDKKKRTITTSSLRQTSNRKLKLWQREHVSIARKGFI